MVADPCSHTMRQKSGIEAGTGPKGEPFKLCLPQLHTKLIHVRVAIHFYIPWVAMKALGCL